MPGCRCAKTAFREVGRGSRGETAKPRCDQPHRESPSHTRTAAAMALARSLSSSPSVRVRSQLGRKKKVNV